MEIISNICEECEKNKIYLAIEPSKSCFIKDYNMWLKLKKRVKSEFLKVNYDPANILWAGKDVNEGVRKLGKNIIHTHAKNIIFVKKCGYDEGKAGAMIKDVSVDKGEVNYVSYITELEKIGYNGFLTIEMHLIKQTENRKKDILKSKNKLESILNRRIK